jgi:type III polyketide synthase
VLSLRHTAAWRGHAVHVLVVASEITSSLARNGLERVDRDQDVRVGLAIFADGASALVLSLDYGTVAGSDEETAHERNI